MLYNHTSEVAIRAALYLVLQPPGKLSPVHEIARATGLPAPYLAKITRRLIRAGLIRAFRGPGGGLELGRPAKAITLWSVVEAMDGPARLEACFLGWRACSEENPCALHARWVPLRAEIQRLLEETTLDCLAGRLRDDTESGLGAWPEVAHPGAENLLRQSERRRST